MNWTQLLTSEIEETYRATEGLMRRVDDAQLDWTPGDGENWMSMGQLLEHCTTACGFCVRGLVTGDWGMPEGELSEEDMLPAAAKMPSAKSVAETIEKLAADKQVALASLAEAGEERIANDPCPAPWDPSPMLLGQRMLGMVSHLAHHKAQLFYYLKMQGQAVNTHDLYGMEG